MHTVKKKLKHVYLPIYYTVAQFIHVINNIELGMYVQVVSWSNYTIK